MPTYRMLPLSEWDRLIPLYTKLFPDSVFPRPEVASAAVIEINGEIVAFWFVQLCMHMEPAGVDPLYSQEVSMGKLRDTLHNSLTGCEGMEYYIYTATPEWDKPLQRAGFRPIGIAYVASVPEVLGVSGGEEVSGSSGSVGGSSGN